jgi:transcriptional regulator with XRE-family HTH domain
MAHIQTIGARQIKAARALLDWSQEDLAIYANLSIATVRKLEMGFISPRHSTTFVIRQAIENAGIEFLADEGIRRRKQDIIVYEGLSGDPEFFADIDRTLRQKGGAVLAVAATKSGCHALNEIAATHRRTNVKCLLTEGASSSLNVLRFEARSFSQHFVDPVPFYVYGDKYAVVSASGAGDCSRVIVIQSVMTAEASRRHFASLWDKALPLHFPVRHQPEVVEVTY